jgi:hypothetical protein
LTEVLWTAAIAIDGIAVAGAASLFLREDSVSAIKLVDFAPGSKAGTSFLGAMVVNLLLGCDAVNAVVPSEDILAIRVYRILLEEALS